MNTTTLVTLATAGTATVIAGIAYGTQVHHDNTMKNMPDSYWEAKKAETDADYKKHVADLEYKKEKDEADRKAIAAKAEQEHKYQLEKQKSEQEFEKNQPPEYWTYKAADREAKSREYAADQERKAKNYKADKEAETQKEQYREMRKMFDIATER